MTSIAISRCANANTILTALQQALAVTEAIRDRAFELFEARNGSHGSDLSDWLQAERELVLSPTAELVDAGKQFKSTIALPGFDAKEIQITATPDVLVVQANSDHARVYRRIDLPSAINVDKVTASIDGGILHLNAPKVVMKQRTAAA